MGTLVCPLCCDEEFTNQLSLRYHLLSITDNVYCPECNQRFDSILQLANHLDGMCGKANLEKSIEEHTSDSDMIITESGCEEENMIIHEGDMSDTGVANELSNPENRNCNFHEEVQQQVISVAQDPQQDCFESVYVVPDVHIQETAVTVIDNEYVDVTVEHGNSRDVMEQSSINGDYEAMAEETVGTQEDLSEEQCVLETSELVGADGQEYEVAEQGLSSACVVMSGSSELQTVLPDMEDPGIEQESCGEYACSSCGITFSSVMEHIRMYHGGQEVVIEVPQAKKIALEKLIRASEDISGSHTEQVTGTEILCESNNTSERADLEETTDSANFVSCSSENQQETLEIHSENQLNVLNDAASKSESPDNVKPYSWFKEKTRVVADEEKIKKIVPGPKRVVTPVHPSEEHVTSELKYVSKEVKISKFWEANHDDESNDNANAIIKTAAPVLPMPSGAKKESKRLLLKKDTRTSIEKLFSGNFLLKGIGGRGTRPGPYLGVNRVPEVKVIMSPGDKGTENAISVFTCSTCQKEFGNVSAFERHSCTIAKTCMMVCKLCDMDISDIKAMRVHMESVHNIKTENPGMAKRKYNMQMLPKPVKCESCDMMFTTMRALKLHSKMHERADLKVPLECPVCHNMCSSNRTLKQHMKVHTKPLPMRKAEDSAGVEGEDANIKAEKGGMLGLLVCKVCYKSFGNNEDLRAHWQEHSTKEGVDEEERQEDQTDDVKKESEDEGVQNKKNTVPCVQCHKEIDKSCKEEHMAKHFSLLRYNCRICNKTFSKHGHLNMHMRIHRGVKEYSCIHCGKIFANMNLLRTHVQSHMVQRPYLCGFCGRGFFRPHDKVEHERIHTGEKPHPCSVCGMRFRVRYCLTLHMRRHTGIRPYNCKVCSKTFRTGTAYKAHTKIHLDERAYKCPFCPKKFNTLIQLSGHKNCHTKPYSCVECNRPFSSPYAVRKHMVSHDEGTSGKDPLKFQCHVCGASYARRFALKDHLKTHGRNIPPAPTDKTCSDDSSSDVL